MRSLAIATTLAFCLATTAIAEEPVGDLKQVSVFGRDWLVWNSARVPGEHVARRQNLEQQPFRSPAILSVRQAVRAYNAATGCTANYDSLYRTDNGDYHVTLICPQ